MRKRQMMPIPLDVPSRDEGWLDLDRLAVVEVTSEDKDFTRWSLRWSRAKRGAGVPPLPALKPSD